ncbi:MAG: hypothetical protein KDB33_05620 [Acidimicrobiales bacterium]|nr:hypothetical protein [Acidimicrobiales bacterium]
MLNDNGGVAAYIPGGGSQRPLHRPVDQPEAREDTTMGRFSQDEIEAAFVGT